MSNIKAVFEEFQLGGVERIFICFYSYFIVGYLILFTIYEDGFINLNLYTQIFLSCAISFPIATISAAILEVTEEDDEVAEEDDELTEEVRLSFLYVKRAEFLGVSIYHSIMFPLFYIFKKSDIIQYNSKLDPLIGLIIIVFIVIFAKLWKSH